MLMSKDYEKVKGDFQSSKKYLIRVQCK